MTDPKNIEKHQFFICNNCDFKCCKRGDYNRHLGTQKHFRLTNTYPDVIKNIEKKYSCTCGKNYKHKQSLFTHKKKCDFKETCVEISGNVSTSLIKLDDEAVDYKFMFFKLLDENKDFKDLLVKQQEQIGELIPKVGNNNNNTINKNKFNINIFLNEQCKDALNMNEFIKSIEVSLDQLDLTKNKGLTEGLSNVLIENMNKLSLYERPMHCTDVKRETLYIKDNDSWEKDKDKTKIKKAIKDASNKQFKTMHQWTQENPDFKEDDLKKDYFVHMLANVSKDSAKVDEKIIKKLCSSYNLKDNISNTDDC
tara:strand:+ start:446 stop:1372 length:927 start_codon:yes stop_codon:yes gene_type:complete